MVWLIVALILPAVIAALLDGLAGIRTRTYARHRRAPVRGVVDDYRILVPIWGELRYLDNVTYLRHYRGKVTLCTTGDETSEFYEGLEKLAAMYDFGTRRDAPQRRTGGKAYTHRQRATSGTIRDRLIRDALADVTEPYVVCLDADTTTREDLSVLVGELAERDLDVASIRLVPRNPADSLLTRLQRFEYRLAMQVRYIAPWMVSGACHVARTHALRDVMRRHSLFFQGNDVETGVIAKACGYRVGHIPFEVLTEVPSALRPWVRQRLAWAGGEFRLFVVNGWLALKHPFFWAYGGLIAIGGVGLRWLALGTPGVGLASALAAYASLAFYVHWRARDRWLWLMPLYTLALSLIFTPLGLLWYLKMVRDSGTWGLVRPQRIR